MKKLLFIIICIVTLFACEDKFEQYYQGGIPALSEFSFYLYTENGGTYISFEDEKGKYCEISVDHQFWRNSVTAKLPSNSATYKMRLDANVDWKFSNLPEWISISPSDGSPKMSFYDGHSAYYENDTISFTVSENTYVSPRFANVYLEGYKDEWKRVDTLRFTQYGISPTIDGEDETITMKAKADTVFRYINSNCDFEVECSNTYWGGDYAPADWFNAKVVKSDSAEFTHKIIITSENYIPSYNDNSYLEGCLRFYIPLENESKEYFDYQLTVRKEGPYITIESDDADSWSKVPPQNGSASVMVSSNCDFEIISNVSWINLANNCYTYSSSAQEIIIPVDDYSFVGDENYDSDGGFGGGASDEETYHEYPTYYDRKSTLKMCYINSKDTIVLKTLSITQSKPTIKQYDSSDGYYSSYIQPLTFGPTAGTQEIYITANYEFNIEHEDWISVKSEAIEHEFHTHKLTISVPEYITDNPENWDSRSGTMVFTYHDKANNSYFDVNGIDIIQEVPKATPSTYSSYTRTFESECTINVEANCEFTPICNGDWIYIKDIIHDDSTSIHNAKIIIGFRPYPEEDAIKNNSFNQRSAELEIYYKTDITSMVKRLSRISFSQYPDKITTAQNTIEINSSGQILSFDIEADLSWSAISDVDWITITPTEGKMGKNTITLNIQQSDVDIREGYIHFYLIRKSYEPSMSVKIKQVKTN